MALTGEDNARLVAAAALGDQSAWDALVAQYNGLLWSIARGFRLGTADAGDVVQNTWLRLVENLDRLVQPDRVDGWLATTVRRECLQLLRRTSRDRAAAVTSEWLDDLPADVAPLDAGLLVAERDAALWRAFESLSDPCRRLLRVLMAWPAPTYRQASAALDMPVGSIGPARQRCLGTLRGLLSVDELLSEGATVRDEP
jgi:RNA polymerase sigma factor (sigma-70 family)